MDLKVKKTVPGLLLILTIIPLCIVHALPTNSRAAVLTEDQIRHVTKESMQLLIEGREPAKEQRQRIQDMIKMINTGELSKEEMHQIVKSRVSMDMEKHKLSRLKIGNMLKRAPKLLPSVTSEDLHKMLWEKAAAMIEKPVTLKFATLAPKGTPWINFPKDVLNPHVEKVTGGKIVVKMYVGGVMGEDIDILRKMDMGQLDGCGCSAQGVLKAAPELSILYLPRLFRNYEEVDHILRKFRKDIDEAIEKKGYILDLLAESGFLYLWMKNKALTLEDIRKQKIMTWFGPVETATFAELGIRPTPISVPEVVTSLNTGLIDAHCGPPPWLLGTQAYTVDRYYVTQPLFYSPTAIIASKKMEDQFRGKYSDTLIHNFRELRIYETRTMEREWIEDHLRPFEKKCIQAFEKYGIKPVTLNEKDMAIIDAAAKRVWKKLAGKVYSKALLDRILKELEEFRQKGKGRNVEP